MISSELHPMLMRKITWDVLPCTAVQQFMPLLGLVPASEEGAEMEHLESHKRLAQTRVLQPHLALYSAMSAKVIAAMALRLNDGPEPDEMVAMVTGQFAETIHIGASVILANLLEQGYLQLGPKVTTQLAVPSGE